MSVQAIKETLIKSNLWFDTFPFVLITSDLPACWLSRMASLFHQCRTRRGVSKERTDLIGVSLKMATPE